MLASNAIGMVVKADDVHALQKDLQKDFVIKSTFLYGANVECNLLG